MTTILDKIVATKRQEIEQSKQLVSAESLEHACLDADPARDFCYALNSADGIAIIAEVKKASPSAGVLRADFDPVNIATIYAEHGAAAISVLTDAPYFQGHLSYLKDVRSAIAVPVLRKDFILERYQLLEARAAGADAVLLIAEILPDDRIATLLAETRALGMQALVELYDADNLPRVLDAGAEVIGINNRDLRSFVTRLEHTLELRQRIPGDRLVVSESGIRTRDDLVRLRQAGVKAVLIGETFMRADDIGSKVYEFRGV